jgi:hypothetical protein
MRQELRASLRKAKLAVSFRKDRRKRMIGRLREAGKRRAVLLWTLALMFAVAPALSLGFAAPAGSFVQTTVHSHGHGGEPHSHHYHQHHGDHDHASGMMDDLGVAHDGQSGHHDHDRVHVHHDASCPSVIVPVPVTLALDQRLGSAVDPRPTKTLHGSSPSRLLRPPIV